MRGIFLFQERRDARENALVDGNPKGNLGKRMKGVKHSPLMTNNLSRHKQNRDSETLKIQGARKNGDDIGT